jgi:hypothetical protein
VNPRRTPCGILCDHAEDEFSQLLARRFRAVANPLPGDPPPVQPEASTVPTDDRFGLDYEESLSPSRPKPSQHDPEQPIRRSETGLWMPRCEDNKLLPQGEIFEQQISARTKETRNNDKPKPQPTVHTLVASGPVRFLLANYAINSIK